MPPIVVPQVQQQGGPGNFVSAPAASDPSGGFGPGVAAVGQALSGASQDAERVAQAEHNFEMQQIEAQRRVQAREDALRRVAAENAYRAKLTELEAGADAGNVFVDPDKITQYRAQLQSEAQQAVNRFGSGGLPDNALLLTEMIENTRAEFDRGAINRGITAGRAALDENLRKRATSLADLVRVNPSAYSTAIGTLNDYIQKQYAPGADPEQEIKHSLAARSMLANAAVDFYLAANDWTGAQAELSKPSIANSMSDADKRSANLKIATGRAAQEADRRHIIPAGAVLVDDDGKILARGGATAGSLAKPIVLKEGERAFDAQGKLIAKGPEPSRRHVLGPGQVLIENGKVIARGNTATHTLAPGQRVVDSAGNTIAEGRNQAFTLSPGQIVLDAAGTELAAGPTQTIVLSEGQTVVDDTGTVIASGSPKERRLYTLKPGDQLRTETGKLVAHSEASPFADLGASDRLFALLGDMSEPFRLGLLTPSEERQFLSLASAAQSVDEVTKTRKELPIVVRDALLSRGIQPHLLGSDRGVEAFREMRDKKDQFGGTFSSTDDAVPARPAQPAAPGAPTAELGDEQLTFNNSPIRATPETETQLAEGITSALQGTASTIENSVAEATSPSGEVDGSRLALELQRRGMNFYQEAGKLTGLMSTFGARLRGIPIIGSAFPQLREVRALRQSFSLMTNMAAPIFRSTERFADAERRELREKMQGLESRFLAEPAALQDDIVGIDNLMALIEAAALDTLDKEGGSSPERQNALQDIVDRLHLLRRLMNVPPVAIDADDAARIFWERKMRIGDRVRINGLLYPFEMLPPRPQGRR